MAILFKTVLATLATMATVHLSSSGVGASPLPEPAPAAAAAADSYTFKWNSSTNCCEVSLGKQLVMACEPEMTQDVCK